MARTKETGRRQPKANEGSQPQSTEQDHDEVNPVPLEDSPE